MDLKINAASAMMGMNFTVGKWECHRDRAYNNVVMVNTGLEEAVRITQPIVRVPIIMALVKVAIPATTETIWVIVLKTQ